MTQLAEVLQRAARDLDRLGAHWALIGGIAISVRTEPRFTRDVDLAIAVPDDRAAESLVRNLLADGYRNQAILEQISTGRLATVRLFSPGSESDRKIVDLLFASSGIENEIVREAEVLEIFSGVSVPVSRTGHLIAMKILARDDEGRPQDRVDLIQLIRAADPTEIERAKTALDLIRDRGFSRGKDLRADLDALLRPPA